MVNFRFFSVVVKFFILFQVFDVVLNGDLTIASDLDIFERVGRGVAFDEYVEFEVREGKILYEGDESEITAGKMRVEFIKVREVQILCRNIQCKFILRLI